MSCISTKTLLGGERLAIALCGEKDSGKTSTLLELAELCRRMRFVVRIDKNSSNGHDKIFVFEDGNLIIGIGTAGDGAAEIDENFDIFDSEKCNIVFVPTRNSGSSWQRFLIRCSGGGYGHKWAPKDKIICACWQPIVNMQVAKILFAWLQR